jgi:hypothetical protein
MFRASLRSINNEEDKFQACLEMRDKLLDRHAELKWLFASIESAILSEGAQYEKEKDEVAGKLQEEEAKELTKQNIAEEKRLERGRLEKEKEKEKAAERQRQKEEERLPELYNCPENVTGRPERQKRVGAAPNGKQI